MSHCDCNGPKKYAIKSKLSGMVLDGEESHALLTFWKGTPSQLWTLEELECCRFIIHNVCNGRVLDISKETKAVLTWSRSGYKNQLWKIIHLNNCNNSIHLETEYFPNHFLVQEGTIPIINDVKQNDQRDEWLLVEEKDMLKLPNL